MQIHVEKHFATWRAFYRVQSWPLAHHYVCRPTGRSTDSWTCLLSLCFQLATEIPVLSHGSTSFSSSDSLDLLTRLQVLIFAWIRFQPIKTSPLSCQTAGLHHRSSWVNPSLSRPGSGNSTLTRTRPDVQKYLGPYGQQTAT